MKRWRITIEVCPHSTRHGREADQKAAGDRERYFYVDANDIGEAFRFAQCFSEGVLVNPAVWLAPIVGVHRWEKNP